MKLQQRIAYISQLYEVLPKAELFLVDVLRSIVIKELPDYCKEKISFGVPFFYGKKGICIIWPASIPKGGIKEGVSLGFWRGNELLDTENYLTRGTNKKIFYKIYKSVDEIDIKALRKLLKSAIELDGRF